MPPCLVQGSTLLLVLYPFRVVYDKNYSKADKPTVLALTDFDSFRTVRDNPHYQWELDNYLNWTDRIPGCCSPDENKHYGFLT